MAQNMMSVSKPALWAVGGAAVLAVLSLCIVWTWVEPERAERRSAIPNESRELSSGDQTNDTSIDRNDRRDQHIGTPLPPPEKTAALRLAGRVRLPDGSPVEHAEVSIAGGNTSKTRTNADGLFELRDVVPGLHEVRVRRDGIAETLFRGVRVTAAKNAFIEMTVEIGRVLGGRVVDDDGYGIDGVEVTAVEPSWNETEQGPGQTRVHTDANGNFVFDTLWDVTYQLSTAAKTPFPPLHYPREYETGRSDVVLVVARGAVFAGRVVNALTSEGVAAASVKFTWRGSGDADFPASHSSSSGVAKTDELGDFAFCFGAPGSLQLSAHQLGYSRSDVLDLREAQPGDKVEGIEIILVPIGAGRLKGQVVNTNEASVAAARVTLGQPVLYVNRASGAFHRDRSATSDQIHVTSDTEGRFEVSLSRIHPRRSYLIQAQHAEHGISQPAEVYFEQLTEPISIPPLVLETAATLKGVVSSNDGADVPNARVELDAWDPRVTKTEAKRRTLTNAWCQTVSTTTNAAGEFELTSLAAGRYQLRVTAAAHVDVTTAPILLEAGRTHEEKVNLEPALTIAGAVAGADGQSVVAARVTATQTNATTHPARLDTETDLDGIYRFEDVPPGMYRIEVQPQGFVKQARLGVFAGAADVDFMFAVSGALNVSAVDASSRKGLTDFQVRLWPRVGASEFPLARDTLGEDRRAHPGSYSLEILAAGYVPWWLDDVSVASGETKEVEAILETGLVIAGTVLDSLGAPVHGARLDVRPVRRHRRTRSRVIIFTDATGSFRASGFVAGDYRMSVFHAGYEEQHAEFRLSDSDAGVPRQPEDSAERLKVWLTPTSEP